MKSSKLTLVSDFNLEPLKRFLISSATLDLNVEVAPFNQVFQSLAKLQQEPDGFVFVWTAPERIIPSFSAAMNLEKIDLETCLADVDSYADALISASEHKQSFVCSWTLSANQRGYGLLDWRPDLGLRNILAQMNLHLARRLAEKSNIFLLDAERWLRFALPAESPKMWYLTKVPYTSPVFEKAAEEIIGAISALRDGGRRLIVLDLDDTLWGGIIGETGWSEIVLGGHDHIGEAFKDFQRELKALSNRGIQLAIVSKNDEAVALEALDNHPEMMLRRSDFIGWRINWQDKATNIVALAEEVRLGLGSIVFIDDNPAERGRVSEALPGVLTPEWPTDPTAYVDALRKLDCFNSAVLSDEDRNRKEMYISERARSEVKSSVQSNDDWLMRLGTRVTVERITKVTSARVAQLFNKTNQINLSTRRLSELEIIEWASEPNHSLFTVSTSDHFGDMGLVGIAGVEIRDGIGYLTDFLLSCRVMGRHVEQAMLHLAAKELKALGSTCMMIEYIPTARNRPTLDILNASGFAEATPNIFKVDIDSELTMPASIAMESLL